MGDWGLKIKRQDVTKDVEDCDPRELVFHSSYPCLKVLQVGKYSFTVSNSSSPTYTINFNADLAFPLVALVYLYDPSDSSYKALGSENVLDHTQNYRGSFWFDSDELHIQVENYTGSSVSTHLIYFLCYA